MIRILLILSTMISLSACSFGSISIQPGGDGTATISISLTESEVNSIIQQVLNASDNPLLRNPSVDLRDGEIYISGEHDRHDGGGRVSGNLTMRLNVSNGQLSTQVTTLNIEGIAASDAAVTNLNERLASALGQRASQSQRGQLQSINITNDQLEIVIQVQRQ